MIKWRIDTFWDKEPETLHWIDSFQQADFFVDVGANIGLYSLYAAHTKGIEVAAFEPESANYAQLNKNIFLNKLDQKIKAYPLAISNEMSLSDLYLSSWGEGQSLHNFKETNDFNNEPFLPVFSQGCLSVSLDELIAKKWIRVPQHIKIDVDGIEDKIIQGALNLIDHPLMKSLLVELNTKLPSHLAVIDEMVKRGYIYSEKQVERALRTHGPFEGTANFIFSKTIS